ncbi:hypothetical protein NE686_12970 [Tissierella carlieri]|uniref:Uncharacterized protein n=1 Tax=Tissierella carlieri TaxID=689904 RepID=A0ABT1SC13_9FIRM|nr:hypothetical protein [Tissierella carlieri]MCQ4924006.1 hypothetical protein [Tissierella carlieri]
MNETIYVNSEEEGEETTFEPESLDEFVALVSRIVGYNIRVIKEDGTKADYIATLDTNYIVSETKPKELSSFDYGDLVYLTVDIGKIEKIVDLTGISAKVNSLDFEHIKVGTEEFKILSETKIFVSQENMLETRSVKDIVDAYKDKKEGVDFEAYVVSGKDFIDKAEPRHDVHANKEDEAYIIVFTNIEINLDLNTRIVRFDGFADMQEKEMRIILDDGTKEIRTVNVATNNIPDLRIGDIIEIKETKDYRQDIEEVKVLITENPSENVFEVMEYDSLGNLTLRDKVGTKAEDDETFYVTPDTVTFGNIPRSGDKISYVLKEDSRYVKAILVRSRTAKVTGLFSGPTNPPDTKIRIVRFDGFIDSQEKKMIIILEDGTIEIRAVNVIGNDMPDLRIGDIIEIKETKDDRKDIEEVKVLITEDPSENVFEVRNYDRYGNLTLRDKVGTKAEDDRTFYVTADTVIFGSTLKISYVLEEDSKYVRAILIRRNDDEITGLFNSLTDPSEFDTRIVRFDGFVDPHEREMAIILEGGRIEIRIVNIATNDMPDLRIGDIIEIKETKDYRKDIKEVKVLITEDSSDNVFEVRNYDRYGNLTLRDKVGTKAEDDEIFYITSDTVILGGTLDNAGKVSYILEEGSRYVKAILVRRDIDEVTGLFSR